MTIPGFTAQASLYSTSSHYRSSASEVGDFRPNQSIVPSYFPGPATQAVCNTCLTKAARDYGICFGIAAVGSAACGPFYPACFGAAVAGCWAKMGWDLGECAVEDCCPKLCGAINPFEPGTGCCDENDTCVDRYDPNSRGGCCPSDQIVCAGKCCAKGESCCGETCCPAGYHCRDGWICEPEFIGDFPNTPPPTPPKRPINYCKIGWEPCGGTCCPPGLQCCTTGGGHVACMTNCLH